MNKRNRGANTNIVQMILDTICLILAYFLARWQTGGALSRMDSVRSIVIVIIFIAIYLSVNREARIYNVTLFFYFDRFMKIVTKSWIMATFTTGAILFFFGQEKYVRRFYLIFLVFSFILILINILFSRLLQMMTTNYNAPRTGFVGVFEDYEKFNYFLNKTSIRLQEVGFINWPDRRSNGVANVLGDVDDLESIIRKYELDQIYFFRYQHESMEVVQPYVDLCIEMGVTVRVVMEAGAMKQYNSYVSSVGIYPMITYHTIALNSYEQLLKRLGDIVIALIGIIITSPIMIATSIAIKADSPGQVLFKQQRVGQNGRVFLIYKFRSMCEDAESQKKVLMDANEMNSDMMFKIKDDPRVTRVGKFIRKTSIDELPQLFNVLIGDMSLVGTRPPTVDEVEKYHRGQWRRISIKPGITGIWQVSGRSDIKDFDEIVKMDLQYIDSWSLGLDIKILCQTAMVLFRRKGAY